MPDDLEKLLAEVKAEIEASDAQRATQITSVANETTLPDPNVDTAYRAQGSNLIAEIAAEYAAQDREELTRQEAEREARDREEREAIAKEIALQQQAALARREAMIVRAKQWLSGLDPHSTEASWFEEFAIGYTSPIEAAIEYLETVKPDAHR